MKRLWTWLADLLNDRPLPRQHQAWNVQERDFCDAVISACAGRKRPRINREGLIRELTKLMEEKGELLIDDPDVLFIVGRAVAWFCLPFRLESVWSLLDEVEGKGREADLVLA